MHGFGFIKPLVADMTQEDPAKRPTMAEVVVRFNVILKGLSTKKLRSRIVYREESWIERVYRASTYRRRLKAYLSDGLPVMPTPKDPPMTAEVAHLYEPLWSAAPGEPKTNGGAKDEENTNK